MSTRSGKRLHNSVHEDFTENKNVVNEMMSERKTRSRRHKENNTDESASKVRKVKLRENYVSYPSDDEQSDSVATKGNKPIRNLRNNTLLKELNFDTVVQNTKEETLKENGVSEESAIKDRRRTRRAVESPELETQVEQPTEEVRSKKKKGKKQKKKVSVENNLVKEEVSFENNSTTQKKKDGKKKRKKGSLTEQVLPEHKETNTSVDSFHSATDSPRADDKEPSQNIPQIRSNETTDINTVDIPKLDSTFDIDNNDKKLSVTCPNTEDGGDTAVDVTFDKSEGDISMISIRSSDSNRSTANIMNTSPVLIESSMEVSTIQEDSPKKGKSQRTSHLSVDDKTPPQLIREGTFTKDGPDPIILTPRPKQENQQTSNSRRKSLPIVGVSPANNKTPNKSQKSPVDSSCTTADAAASPDCPVTPTRKKLSLPAPGSTPYHSNTKKREINLNLTHSVEKPVTRISSCIEPVHRQTRVMFCSPVNSLSLASQRKSRVIKSSMKGSNKSFVFEDKARESRPVNRKRSHTHSEAEEARSKRTRLNDQLQGSVNRLSRPRTQSATGKLAESDTPSKSAGNTPHQAKSARTQLPDFASLHRRHFDRMESLDECQQRKAKRAKALLSPSGTLNVLERKTPSKKAPVDVARTSTTPTKKNEIISRSVQKPPTLASLIKPGYTRFGFKMHTDVNPFSIPPSVDKSAAPATPANGLLKREVSQPSLYGNTSRKQIAKQTIMREKSSTSLKEKRNETRTIIKGVRTNRRFELQMKSRNMNA